MPEVSKIIELRKLLAERFPAPVIKPGLDCATGLAPMDRLLEGGLRRGSITELISETPSNGCALALACIIRAAAERHQWVALVDGLDTFTPESVDETAREHLLWIRCRTADEALRAADLVLRDGNLPLVLLDLRSNPAAELRKIPNTNWYRLQRLVEQNTVALLVTTPRSLVSSARAKLFLQNRFTLHALEEPQPELLEAFTIQGGIRASRQAASQ